MSIHNVTPQGFVPSQEQLQEPFEPDQSASDSLIARLHRSFPDSADQDMPPEFDYQEPDAPASSDTNESSASK